jgi:uncharacterized protein (DUF433 family)
MDVPNYVERVAGGQYRIAGSRIGLESVVRCYLDGQSPESIQDNFPTLALESIHGSIAFYLRHREEIDRYLNEIAVLYDELQKRSEEENSPLLNRLRAERQNLASD